MNASAIDRFVAFECDGDTCIGVLSEPAEGVPVADVAVLIVVGGPQYRVGSHRQFVLLARALAAGGVPTLRFDYRGMGDSAGAARTFESIEPDVAAAIDTLVRETGIARVVVWGLCDAASAALMYAASDARVAGIVAVNPWARTEAGQATTRLRYYYVKRLLSRAFWRKLLRGSVRVRDSATDFAQAVRSATGDSSASRPDYLQRMQQGWQKFRRPVLVLLSGDDFTAREFEAWIASDQRRTALLRGDACDVYAMPEADHTFSRRAWRDAVAQQSLAWIKSRFTLRP